MTFVPRLNLHSRYNSNNWQANVISTIKIHEIYLNMTRFTRILTNRRQDLTFTQIHKYIHRQTHNLLFSVNNWHCAKTLKILLTTLIIVIENLTVFNVHVNVSLYTYVSSQSSSETVSVGGR